jgi:hypothetical protein
MSRLSAGSYRKESITSPSNLFNVFRDAQSSRRRNTVHGSSDGPLLSGRRVLSNFSPNKEQFNFRYVNLVHDYTI